MLACVNTALPMAVIVTPANVNDSPVLSDLVQKAAQSH